MKRIIFKNTDNSVGVIIPAEEALSFATIEQIASKDVPAGLEYVIVDTDTIPTDRTFRDAWEWGFDESDGMGAESNEFPQEVLDAIN